MKRKPGDRPGWARIAERSFTVARVELPAYRGVVALYSMLRVHAPLVKPVAGAMTLIADDDFSWLQFYSADPDCQTYTVTAMFTPTGVVAQWYIDVCAGHGVDRTGIPWHDDLYLDVVVNGAGAVAVIDAADLEAALDAGAVDLATYDQAWSEAHRLAALARRGSLPEMRFAVTALTAMAALARGESVPGFTPMRASR